MRVIRRLASALLLAAVIGAALPAAPASATTAQQQLELSVDGRTWSSSIPEALFDALPLIVPGDSVARTLYVRNTGSSAGLLRLDAIDVRISNPEFARALRVGAVVDSATLGSSDLSGSSDCITVLPSGRIAAGAVATVEITLAFDENAPMLTQDSTAGFSLLLSVSEDVGQAAPAGGCPEEGIELPTLPFPDDGATGSGEVAPAGTAGLSGATGAGLALTGASVMPLLAAGTGSVLLGLAALTVIRRRKSAE